MRLVCYRCGKPVNAGKLSEETLAQTLAWCSDCFTRVFDRMVSGSQGVIESLTLPEGWEDTEP